MREGGERGGGGGKGIVVFFWFGGTRGKCEEGEEGSGRGEEGKGERRGRERVMFVVVMRSRGAGWPCHGKCESEV